MVLSGLGRGKGQKERGKGQEIISKGGDSEEWSRKEMSSWKLKLGWGVKKRGEFVVLGGRGQRKAQDGGGSEGLKEFSSNRYSFCGDVW